MSELRNDVLFQLSVPSVLDRVYTASAMADLAGVRGEKGVRYGRITRDHERLLLTMVKDACSCLAMELMSNLSCCRLDDACLADGKVDFVLKLPKGLADGVAMSLRRHMEHAVALNVLESVWLGHDVDMTEYYRGRAVAAVAAVKSCIRRMPVGPLRLVSHW